MTRREQGLTLIELLVVLVILGILMGVAVPALGKVIDPDRVLVQDTLKVQRFLKRARVEAIRRGRELRVLVDEDQSLILMDPFVDLMEETSPDEEDPRLLRRLRLNERLSLEVFSPTPLPEEEEALLAETEEEETPEEETEEADDLAFLPSIVFYHTGCSNGAGLRIAEEERLREVVCDVLLGTPSVQTGKEPL